MDDLSKILQDDPNEGWIEHHLPDEWPKFPENEKKLDWSLSMRDMDKKYLPQKKIYANNELQRYASEQRKKEFPGGVPNLNHNIKLLANQNSPKKKGSIVGEYLKRNPPVKKLKDVIKELPKAVWEFDKKPGEKLADAEKRRRDNAEYQPGRIETASDFINRVSKLSLLEQIKIELKQPSYNFHEE